MTYFIAFASAFGLFMLIMLWSLFELYLEQRKHSKALKVEY